MTATAFALVVTAGVLHALWNIAAKRAAGDARFALFSSAISLVLWAPLAAWAAWAHPPHWGAAEWALVTLSALLHVLYFLVLLRGYRVADLTVVYPVARGAGPLGSSAVALVLFGESLTLASGIGLAAVVGGVFLVAGGVRLLRASHTPEERARTRRGIGYGLATGAFIAAYTVVDGYGVKTLLLSPLLYDYVGGALRVVLLLPAVRMGAPGSLATLWRAQWRRALVVGALSPAAYLLVLYALQHAPMSRVAPAREVSMLFAALIGGRLLQEGDRAARLAGAACIAAGVVLLGLGG